jgi:hypothetical protein
MGEAAQTLWAVSQFMAPCQPCDVAGRRRWGAFRGPPGSCSAGARPGGHRWAMPIAALGCRLRRQCIRSQAVDLMDALPSSFVMTTKAQRPR